VISHLDVIKACDSRRNEFPRDDPGRETRRFSYLLRLEIINENKITLDYATRPSVPLLLSLSLSLSLSFLVFFSFSVVASGTRPVTLARDAISGGVTSCCSKTPTLDFYGARGTPRDLGAGTRAPMPLLARVFLVLSVNRAERCIGDARGNGLYNRHLEGSSRPALIKAIGYL